MPLEFRKTGGASAKRPMILVQGPGMSGKTTFAAGFPDPLFVDWDENATLDQFEVNTVGNISWREYKDELVAMASARRLECKTIVLDTLSLGVSNQLAPHVKGSAAKLRIQDFGTILDELMSTTRSLLEATRPTNDHPGYNVVVCCHDHKETDEGGAVIAIRPAILGQFRDILPRLVDVVLIAEQRLERVTQAGEPSYMEQKYVLHTRPPSGLYVAGDRIGPGRGKPLPPTLTGGYQELMSSWGLEP